jgi:hypothetical protein
MIASGPGQPAGSGRTTERRDRRTGQLRAKLDRIEAAQKGS